MNSDCFDFNFYVFWQMGNFNVRMCWEGGIVFGEEGFVGSINGCEVVQIFYKYGGFNDVVYFQVCGFDDCFYVIQ